MSPATGKARWINKKRVTTVDGRKLNIPLSDGRPNPRLSDGTVERKAKSGNTARCK